MSVFSGITQKVSNTAKAAAKKSNDIVEVTKLHMSISAEEDKIKKLYGEIGKALYESYERGEPIGDAFKDSCEQIQSISENIKQMKQKILELKNLKACSNCSAELDADVIYCPRCGTKQ
ncbi:zinc-ribbon domain-containing protein [Clostridium thermosuccinogenes]|uniref:Zinc-ribbon domain-containing protein n=1 Tax=Clostridium thermosuccinogenes TaxID=84032 RepID=A0A2K2F1Q6_9CLOT|nr:zinc ribbon domain-containing protein [Pseudoclostridium thermosuccinogenes]AUS96619.1 zinc-ribbon domain-containing protein [Pseudoclostridium thermosuccinogenes]PNT92721.1 zinc-ribbon domain-containing protein [Pseudoclostridium thermosuccinogenes]PNT97534.1 zinc-ribbon domain-containing protein [Pseudoclostridium thermosuccinogenes]PNT99531.1 zinc-ribbon domain-containing protein [Pseudoclostridium thermosuccinogenes]